MVGCYKGKIYFHDMLTGKLSWTVQTDGEVQLLHFYLKYLLNLTLKYGSCIFIPSLRNTKNDKGQIILCARRK